MNTFEKTRTYCKWISQIFAQLQKASYNSVYFCYNTHFQKNVENCLHNKSLLYSEGGGRKFLRDTAEETILLLIFKPNWYNKCPF